MNRRSVTVFFMMLVALFFLATSNYAQDFVRSEEIPFPDADTNNGGTGGMIAGTDIDGDGKLEIFVVNDNWNDTPGELIPRIYKLEKEGSEWQVVWQAVAPVPKQNTWPALAMADLDKDGKMEIIWGIVNFTDETNTNPARILVYEEVGDGSDVMGLDNGAGNFLPNTAWKIATDDNVNVRPTRFVVADVDDDGVDEVIFSERAGAAAGYYFGVCSVDNVPDNGDGSEAWTLETSGKDFALASTIKSKYDVAVVGKNIYTFDQTEISKVFWSADEFAWKYQPLRPMAGGYSFAGAQVVDIDNNGTLEILAGEYTGGIAATSLVLLQEDADTLKHTVIAQIGDAERFFGGAQGDIDQDGYVDFVFGTRAGDPDGALYRVAYRGGDITNPDNYDCTTLDSLYFIAGYTNVIDIANMDDDPALEVLYTSSIPAGEFPNDGTLPIVVLDYVGTTGIAFDELIIAPEVQFQGGAPDGIRFKPGRILDNGKTIWFAGENRTSVVEETYVWRSVDGGQTFTHNENPLPSFVAQMDAFNADVAIIALIDGTIHRTTDGGVTWEQVYAYETSPGTAGFFDGLRVLGDQVAVAIGDGEADGYMHFVRTEDQGETWSEVLTCNYLGAAYSYYTWGGATSSVGQSMWVSATPTTYVGSYVFRTHDGGLTWDSFSIPSDVIPSYPRGIAFANVNEGIIADRRGNAVASNDGGATWYKSNRPDTSADSWINSAAAIPGTNIIMGLDDIGVYATSNLGDSWTKLVLPSDLPGDSYFTAGIFHSTKFGYMFADGVVCRFKNQLTGVAVRPDEKMPAAFQLHQNYPNPFNPTTTISYDVVTPDRVSLKIYNLKGEEIKTLVDGVVASGNHSIVWDATNNSGNKVASGMYIYTIKVGDGQAHRRMMLLK